MIRSIQIAPIAISDVKPNSGEIRVLGCLIEKQRTTPDAYPLSLNALRLACNQATNRDPVVDYDEEAVVEALRRLALRSWTRLASGPTSRARKYRHLLGEALDLDDAEISILAVLMLRGPQTPGELKQRSDRLHSFPDLAAVHDTLDRLIDRNHVTRHPRRPGQKEDRYEHLLSGEAAESAPDPPIIDVPQIDDEAQPSPTAAPDPSPASTDDTTAPPPSEIHPPEDRLDRFERELADLRDQITHLREALGE